MSPVENCRFNQVRLLSLKLGLVLAFAFGFSVRFLGRVLNVMGVA